MLCLGDPVSFLALADNAHVGPDRRGGRELGVRCLPRRLVCRSNH